MAGGRAAHHPPPAQNGRHCPSRALTKSVDPPQTQVTKRPHLHISPAYNRIQCPAYDFHRNFGGHFWFWAHDASTKRPPPQNSLKKNPAIPATAALRSTILNALRSKDAPCRWLTFQFETKDLNERVDSSNELGGHGPSIIRIQLQLKHVLRSRDHQPVRISLEIV